MKKVLCVLLILTLVLLCGCQKNNVTPDEPAAPDGTEFAATTVYDDEVLTFEVTSAKRTESGIAYAVSFQNKADESVNVEVSNITVNGEKADIALTATLEKGASYPATLTLPLAADKTANEVGLHLTVTPADRWWIRSLISRDLVFYPVPQATATATATATSAA